MTDREPLSVRALRVKAIERGETVGTDDVLWLLDECERLSRIETAARSFIETMPIRLSQIEGRDVVGGFTAASSAAALVLFDELGPSRRPGD